MHFVTKGNVIFSVAVLLFWTAISGVQCDHVSSSSSVRSTDATARSNKFLWRSEKENKKTEQEEDIWAAMRSLYQDVWSLQWNHSKPYQFPVEFGHRAGTFQNNIKINFVGGPIMTFLRNNVSIPDDNMFVIPFVLEAVIQAGLLHPDVAPLDDEKIQFSLETALINEDKYQPEHVPIYGFWPQKYVNGSWRQWSINLSAAMADDWFITDILKFLLDKLNLEWVYDIMIVPFRIIADLFLHVFDIPADADDTSTTIALVSRWIKKFPAQFPKSGEAWARKNLSVSSAFRAIVNYSYCPAAKDDNQTMLNAIDSRTYFWCREFLTTEINQGEEEECIVTTWIESFQDMLQHYRKNTQGPLMPFNMNNVDPTVAANSLYGMSASLLLNEDTMWFRESSKARQVYVTTAKFVAWSLKRQWNQTRPDLEMLYYPTVMMLPWLVSRHVQMLASYADKADHARRMQQPQREGEVVFPFVEMQQVFEILKEAAEDGGTEYILRNQTLHCQMHATDYSDNDVTCWDGFLGQGDKNSEGEPTPHPDDRFFVTSVALSALIDTWTIMRLSMGRKEDLAIKGTNLQQQKVYWLEDTPTQVKNTVAKGIRFLLQNYAESKKNNGKNATTETVSFENVFFSGSVKSINTFPFSFPANYILQMNNLSAYNCDTFEKDGQMTWEQTLWAMRGNKMSEETYQMHLKNGCGKEFPTDDQWKGLNRESSPWPYWSAPVLSKAVALSAMAKYASLM